MPILWDILIRFIGQAKIVPVDTLER